jgi:hypothetical protein
VRPSADELLQAFRLIDDRLAAGAVSGPLLSLRRRLAGELLGDPELVSSTLAENFELGTHAGAALTVSGRQAVIASVERMADPAARVLMWVKFDDLLSDRDAIAVQGDLLTIRSVAARGPETTVGGQPGLSLTSMPIALFLRFRGDLMTSETIYLNSAASTSSTLPNQPMPSAERLRAILGIPAQV